MHAKLPASIDILKQYKQWGSWSGSQWTGLKQRNISGLGYILLSVIQRKLLALGLRIRSVMGSFSGIPSGILEREVFNRGYPPAHVGPCLRGVNNSMSIRRVQIIGDPQ